VLAIEGSEKICGSQVKTTLTQLFLNYGLPLAIRSDNGAPFATHAIAGLSQLSVWLIRLGIVPERIRKGHPEENGRHERMHLTLKKETALPPKETLIQQQLRFDEFKKEFNEQRPHEGINFDRPAWRYQHSTREYPSKFRPVEYDNTYENTRKIRTNGTMKWMGKEIFISNAYR
jgi:putative transposase